MFSCRQRLRQIKYSSYKIAYTGDDLNDMVCIECCGFTDCSADVADEVKKFVNFIYGNEAGRGAIRELIQLFQIKE